ncbi:hypothetical protein RN001_000174 [Aquatica leii]|uniref:TsaA-like domain-containing protein n=1 Tax=Aquatica leii TaxID=1421715 RepID=A0AAN7SQG8_9COLE|nr:hypothetical protein RN001_000174 [Aquatica leii]
MTDNDKTNDVTHLKTQLTTARNEISNLRQQLKGLKHTYRKDCDEIKQHLENWKCQQCKNKQADSTTSTPIEAQSQIDLSLSYIGVIRTHFPEKRGTPRQPGICSGATAKLTLNNVVFTNPEHSLEGLQDYSHMWILFHFHKNDSNHTRAKVSPPRLNGLRTGIFATRSPHRPCPIGLSLVKIDRIMENTIYFSGVDMIDQTPVLDIKPYIPRYDNPALTTESVDSLLDVSTVSSINISDAYLSDNVNTRVMDGEENGEREQAVIGASSSNFRNNTGTNLEETYHESRSISRIGEREAPDGEEEESVAAGNLSQQQVRVPSWIDQPPISTLTVYFKQRALLQLQQLGNEGEQKKNIIRNVLQEDPRSVYLRERVENTNYVFRIADLYVSCKFDDGSHIVTVFQVFQDSVAQGDD